MIEPAVDGDTTCEICGAEYFWDEKRTCWRCNRPLCPRCLNETGRSCPECPETAIPEHLEPMLAVLGDLPSDPSGWGFEFKWDGVRAITYLDGHRLSIESRLLSNITARYPELHRLGRIMDGRSAIFDGEIIALDNRGRPSFHLLQHRMHLGIDQVARVRAHVPAHYYLFDLLFLDGESLLDRPYRERRERLDALSIDDPQVRIPSYYPASGSPLLEIAREHGLEGIVCKQLESPYRPGRRTGEWIKVKIVSSEEFVVGGWTPERNNPGRIGALLLGYYETGRPGLVYAGKAGSGFKNEDHRLLRELLEPLRTDLTPFRTPVPEKHARYVTPKLVVTAAYRRWNPEGSLQMAVYQGLRSDIPSSQVIDLK